MSDETDQT